MATCKNCIHEKLCVIKAFPDAFENTEWSKKPCDHFKPTADVASKSEVAREIFEEIQKSIVHNILHNESCSFECVIDCITKDLDELKKKYTKENK